MVRLFCQPASPCRHDSVKQGALHGFCLQQSHANLRVERHLAGFEPLGGGGFRDVFGHGFRPRVYCAGSRNSQRMASILASNSGESVVPQASRFSSSCATVVTPMMVLLTCHLV